MISTSTGSRNPTDPRGRGQAEREVCVQGGEAEGRASISQGTVLVIWQDSDVKKVHSLGISKIFQKL